MASRNRIDEPWGYRDQNDYLSREIIHERDLDSFFSGVEYKRDDNKIHFSNKDGVEVGTLNVDDFIKSDQIVERAWYEDGKIYIKFTNGDLITIDVKELLDENEFRDGLQVVDGVVSVLKDPTTERWLTVSSNGVKVSGIQAEIDRLDERIDNEIDRATSEEERIEGRLNQEIEERILDVDEEETRAKSEERRIEAKLDAEITRSKDVDDALDTRIGILNDALTSERSARESADLSLSNRLNSESTRAASAETGIDTRLVSEINNRKAQAVNSAEYVKADKKIYFKNINGATISNVDVSDFLTGGMIEDVRVENGKLIIVFNTTTGEETIEVPLTDIFDPDNYYTKQEIDGKVSTINSNVAGEATARENGDNALQGEITALSATVGNKANTSDVNASLALKADKTEIPTDFYTKSEVDGKDATLQGSIDAETARAISAETDLEVALSGKADANVVYTQEEVDALIAEKEAEIADIKSDYVSLKKIVGDMGGNVIWSVPEDGSFDSMMKNNGTVKLTEDITSKYIYPGATANTTTTLNINGKNLTLTGLTLTSTTGGLTSRYKENLTIKGGGIIDSGDGIAVMCTGEDAVVNIEGNMFGGNPTITNNRTESELIYCYSGTINISGGTFKGNGSPFTLNCYDANYQNGTAKIIVTGGKFYDFNPADNASEGEHTNFVAEGYHVETSTDGDSTVYTVKKDA